MPLSPEDLEKLLDELRRQMINSGFGDLDAAILRLESELTLDVNTAEQSGPSAPPDRLRFYLDQLDATLGSTTESYDSTLSVFARHVETDGLPQFRLVLPSELQGPIRAEYVDLERIRPPTILLRELREILNEALEA